jgi:hypothetical protein
MKVEIKNKKQNTEIKFPCLMINKNEKTIVLATSINTESNDLEGTCISENGFGHHDTKWTASDYTPFNGSITLSNDWPWTN